ncbi:MAG TPA: amino acid--tRNA ligase-related protein, partial [Steroidobacteraceae bacterium]|nr:amino acid--tRNA ligase-related protein [Steroidobacteraceae bacterium]
MNAPSRGSPAAGADWRPTASMATLRQRAQMLARVREYFAVTGALEVETPALVRAPVTDVHLEALRVVDDAGPGTTVGYLQTSPEYAMKRLLCSGAPDIFQLCRVHRAGERGRRHNPEFTMLEWYRRDMDHHALMRDVEALVGRLLAKRPGLPSSVFLAYRDAFHGVIGIDPLEASVAELVTSLEQRGVS